MFVCLFVCAFVRYSFTAKPEHMEDPHFWCRYFRIWEDFRLPHVDLDVCIEAIKGCYKVCIGM